MLVLTGFILMPFVPVTQAATATGSLTVTTVTPNVDTVTIAFPALSGGADASIGVAATSSLEVTGSSGTTTSITIDGTELLTGDVDFNTDANTTASDLAAAISAGGSGYTATSLGSTVIITASSTGTLLNGETPVVTSTYITGVTAFSGGAAAGSAVAATSLSSAFASTTSATGSDMTLNIGGTPITLAAGVSGDVAASTTADAINADASNPYSASVESGNRVRLTADATGSAGNGAVIATDLSYNTAAQVVTFVPTNVTDGETFRISINGTNYDFTANASSTVADVTAALSVMADANAAVSCTEDGTSITCTASTPGTGFSASAFVFPASGSTLLLLSPVTISSNSENAACAAVGDTVTLNFTASESLGASTTVMIAGQTVPLVSLGGNMYSASTTLTVSTSEGVVSFMIHPYDSGNVAATTTTTTTNDSSVTFDMTPPVINLNGSANLDIPFSANFTDPGATATDNLDAEITVVASGTIDTEDPGTQTITYTATDCAGNTATTTRTATVRGPSFSGGSSSGRGNSGTPFGQIVSAVAHILPPVTTGPALPLVIRGEVLGASTDAETQAQIAVIKSRLVTLITQLISMLQAQVNDASR